MLGSAYKELWEEGHHPGLAVVQFAVLCVPFIRPAWLRSKQIRPALSLHGFNVCVAAATLTFSLTTSHYPQGTPYLVVGQFFAFGVGYCVLQYHRFPQTVDILTHMALVAYSGPVLWFLFLVVTA